MSGDVHHDRKMSDAEGLMWRLEKDPYLSSTFANVTILDRAPELYGKAIKILAKDPNVANVLVMYAPEMTVPGARVIVGDNDHGSQ